MKNYDKNIKMDEYADYYILWVRLDVKDHYLIWYSREEDGVIVNNDDYLVNFSTTDELLKYAIEEDIKIEGENPKVNDLDLLSIWLQGNVTNEIDIILNSWNLFADVAKSIKSGSEMFLAKEQQLRKKDLYFKVFHQCNLPTLKNRIYSVPKLNKLEESDIRGLLSLGLNMVRKKLVPK